MIRQARPDDGAAVAAIYGPFCTATPVSFEEEAPTAAEMADRIRKVTARYPWLVLEDGGTVAGYAYAAAHRERPSYRWAVDVSVYVAEACRRRGVGRALYTALLDLLPHLGFFQAFAGITLPNPGSTGLHAALGFVPVGTYRSVGYKLGAWHDTFWLQRTLQPPRPAPPEPRPVAEVLGSPAWEAALAKGVALYRPAGGTRPPEVKPPAAGSVRRLHTLGDAQIDALADVLVDCVEGGASISFMHPLPREGAAAFWRTVAAGVAAGERAVLVAEDARGICGTVQLILAQPDNQPHRADLVKMLVHRRARRQGVAAALMRAAEAVARECGKTLLVLDAVTDGPAARLYERLGWVRVGDIPNFALWPQGGLCSTTYYYRDLSGS